MTDRIKKLITALEQNNMQAFYAENREKAMEKLKELLPKGGVVTHGGSVTLQECGVPELLKNGDYQYLDRSAGGLTPVLIEELYRKSFFADAYVTSANAVTMDGLLYNVDGNSNRVAAILYGPKQVIFIVGINKIVDNLEQAVERVRAIAAPKNNVRLGCANYCKEKGRCVAKAGAPMGLGCGSDSRICCNYVVSARQRQKNRIKVIIVNEELGY